MVSPHTPTSSNSSALFGSDDTSFLEALVGAVLPGDVIPQASNVGETVQDPSITSSAPNKTEASSSSLEPPSCAQHVPNALSNTNGGDEEDTRSAITSSSLKHSPAVLSEDDEPSLLQLQSPTPAQSRYKKRAYSVSSGDDHPTLGDSPADSPTKGTNSYLDSDTYGASRFGGFGEYMRRKRAKLQIQNVEMGDAPGAGTSKSKLFNGLSIHVSQPSWCYWSLCSRESDQRLDRALCSGITQNDR
jgi:DNA repair protein REV1